MHFLCVQANISLVLFRKRTRNAFYYIQYKKYNKKIIFNGYITGYMPCTGMQCIKTLVLGRRCAIKHVF